ncbi:MAG TPA: formate--tetrahydrofolate ligase [Candidatus Oscillibacter pullicola]|nr:formate--tetrahydrofolate ligase [Candidatus Oscillibacter pullicola]
MSWTGRACPAGSNAGSPRDLSRGVPMPGLSKVPAAERIDVDENGRISGLF